MRGRPAAALAVMALLAAACHRADKTDQLAALEGAYKSGVMTKEEYDAKRLALTGPPPAVAPAPTPAAPVTVAPTPALLPEPAPTAAPPPAVQPEPQPAPVSRPARHAAAPAARTIQPTPQPSTPPATPPPIAPPAAPAAEAREPEPAPLAGCEDAEFKSGGQKGAQERFFAASPEAVRRAAVSAFDSMDFVIHKNSSQEIDASRRRHIGVVIGAGGERVILLFQKSEQRGRSGTRVIGQTKKSFVGHVSQRTWTDAVMAQISCKLGEGGR